MTTVHKAAQQALEAFEKLVGGRFTYFKGNAVGHDIPLTREDIDSARAETIASLRAQVESLRSALAQPGEPPEYQASPMNAKRAAYFMERFKKEEKLLGPNEQAAVDFVLEMLAQQGEPVAHCTVEPLRGDESVRRHSVKWVVQPVAGPLYAGAAPAAQPVQGEQPAVSDDMLDFEARGYLTSLTFWHHMTEEDSDELSAFLVNLLRERKKPFVKVVRAATPSTPKPYARKVIEQMVGALDSATAWDKGRKFIIPYKVRDPMHAAIQAGQKWLEENK